MRQKTKVAVVSKNGSFFVYERRIVAALLALNMWEVIDFFFIYPNVNEMDETIKKVH